MSLCLLWEKISTICSISLLRNYRKYKYIGIFPKKYLAQQGLSHHESHFGFNILGLPNRTMFKLIRNARLEIWGSNWLCGLHRMNNSALCFHAASYRESDFHDLIIYSVHIISFLICFQLREWGFRYQLCLGRVWGMSPGSHCWDHHPGTPSSLLSHCISIEDWYSIFKWVTVTCLKDREPGW